MYTAFLRDGVSPFSLLVYHDSETGHFHKFLHQNYTMFRCLWTANVTMYDKIHVFRDMHTWLHSNNETLKASFIEEDDYITWNIAAYIHDGGEYHFD